MPNIKNTLNFCVLFRWTYISLFAQTEVRGRVNSFQADMNKSEWNDCEDLNIDGCSTASSVSTRAESVASNASPKAPNSNKANSKTVHESIKLVNQDSLSDAELSDFSINDSDDEEFRVQSFSGKSRRNIAKSKKQAR